MRALIIKCCLLTSGIFCLFLVGCLLGSRLASAASADAANQTLGTVPHRAVTVPSRNGTGGVATGAPVAVRPATELPPNGRYHCEMDSQGRTRMCNYSQFRAYQSKIAACEQRARAAGAEFPEIWRLHNTPASKGGCL